MVDIVDRLRRTEWNETAAYMGNNRQYDLVNPDGPEAAEVIERLRKKVSTFESIYKHMNPEKFPEVLFIHGTLGEKDKNGMPEKLLVVPAYGCDWSQVYEKTEKVSGPEW